MAISCYLHSAAEYNNYITSDDQLLTQQCSCAQQLYSSFNQTLTPQCSWLCTSAARLLQSDVDSIVEQCSFAELLYNS
jgi:hypothetical protein